MRVRTSRIALMIAVIGVAGSCTPLRPPQGKSPLARPTMSPDSVVLDIFFVRFPFGDPEANGPLWDEIDEQRFPTDVRRELTRNGFRAGVVVGQIPTALAQLLELSDKPPPADQTCQSSASDLESAPTVVRRHKQLRAGRPCEIQASDVYPDLPVVMCQSGDLCGRSYSDAQAMLVVKPFPTSGDHVRLEVVPQIEYGQSRPRYVGTHGALRLEVGRDRRVFEKLALSADVATGSMIVMGCVDARPGSLGYHFFTRTTDGRLEQKLLVIRLSQTQHDDLFDPDGVLPLDEVDQ